MRTDARSIAFLAIPAIFVVVSLIAFAVYVDRYNPHLRKQVQYGPNNSKGFNSLDLYLPDKQVGPLPLVIWIHGGGWTAGDKYPCPAGPLLKNGFAVASINYRLSQEAIFPAQIVDCKAALSFLRKNATSCNIDPGRIGVWGASAGGLLVSLLGTTGDVKTPSWASCGDVSVKVQAVCDWCGPSDLLTIKKQSGPVVVMDHADPAGPVSKFLGGTVADRKDLAREASPVSYVRAGLPPFLIMHGDHDELVPDAQSRELDAALKKVGSPSQLVIVEKGAHDFYSTEAMEKVIAFFKQHLAAPAPL